MTGVGLNTSLPPYRLLITGSRTWPDPAMVEREISTAIATARAQFRPVVIVHGACPTGADQQASVFAAVLARRFPGGVSEETHPADWRAHGRGAGYRRNAEMVNAGADLCLAFILDGSDGASHTADLAVKAGIPVRRYTEPNMRVGVAGGRRFA